MRLIDVDELKKCKFTAQLANGVEIYDIEIVLVASIDNVPTVDTYTKDDLTREYLKGYNDCKDMNGRSQGKWIPQTDFDGFTYWKCSECNKKNDLKIFNFCPHCGADMRVVKEADNE